MQIIKFKGGDEQDLFTGWRHVLCWPRGEKKRIKRKYSKRVRQALKKDILCITDDRDRCTISL